MTWYEASASSAMSPEREAEIRELAERLAQPGSKHRKIAAVLSELLAELDASPKALSASEIRRQALLDARFAGKVTSP